MVNATNGVQNSNPLSLTFSSANTGSSVNSFAQQLASAIEGYLGNVQNGSHFEIDIQSGQNQNFTVSVKNLGTAAAPVPAPDMSLRNMSLSDMSPSGTSAPIDKSTMTPTDAYWAEQPPAIQALRYTPDDQRAAAAQSLAQQGYPIDVPIMVWGWR